MVFLRRLPTFATFIFVVTTFAVNLCHGWGSSNEKVLLKEVQAITLNAGSMTTGRRSSAVSQLMYKGSSSLAHYAPSTVQCRNRGHDGYDVQWECVADLPAEVKFGQINVICEGFDYPDDPYILKGSCGLEYTLNPTGAGGWKQDYSHHGYNTGIHTGHHSSSVSPVFVLLALGGVIYLMYHKCLAPSRRPVSTAPPQATGTRAEANPPPPRRNRLYPDIPPPPYPGTQPSAPESDPPPAYGWAEECMPGASEKTRPYAQPTQSPPQQPQATQTGAETNSNTDQSGPGFFSGGILGGIVGYLFGRRNRRQGHYNHQGGWGNNWGNSWGNDGGWNDGWGAGWGGRQQRRHYRNYGNSWSGGSPGNAHYGGGGSSWFGSGTRSSSGTTSSGSTHRSSGFGGTSRR